MSKVRITGDFTSLDVNEGNVVVSDEIKHVKPRGLFHLEELNWTDKQKKFIELCLDANTRIILCKGPAGSSKTLTGVYSALNLLNKGRVEDIIYLFKTAMLPDTFGSDESSTNVENYFNYPNLVDVSWEGQCAKHMDGFLPSVITACDVKYNNGGKFATFETGQPLNITMDLTIQEIKILTQETYQQIACEGSSGRLHRPDTSIGEGTPSILDTNRTGG